MERLSTPDAVPARPFSVLCDSSLKGAPFSETWTDYICLLHIDVNSATIRRVRTLSPNTAQRKSLPRLPRPPGRNPPAGVSVYVYGDRREGGGVRDENYGIQRDWEPRSAAAPGPGTGAARPARRA